MLERVYLEHVSKRSDIASIWSPPSGTYRAIQELDSYIMLQRMQMNYITKLQYPQTFHPPQETPAKLEPTHH